MSQTIYARVRTNPKFRSMTADRSRFAWVLTLLVLVAYYSFMMTIAFAPEVLRKPIWPGATLTLGIPLGVAIIIGSWLLTGLYIRRANGRYEQMNEEIIKEAG